MLQSILNLLQQLTQVSNDIFGLITAGSVVVAWISVHFHFQNKYLAAIANACLVAEKAIDSAAYNGGTQIDQTRLAIAVGIVQMAFPKLSAATISADITEYVTGIHNTIDNLPPAQQNLIDNLTKAENVVKEEVQKIRKPRAKKNPAVDGMEPMPQPDHGATALPGNEPKDHKPQEPPKA